MESKNFQVAKQGVSTDCKSVSVSVSENCQSEKSQETELQKRPCNNELLSHWLKDYPWSSSSKIFHDVLKNCFTTEFSADSVIEFPNLPLPESTSTEFLTITESWLTKSVCKLEKIELQHRPLSKELLRHWLKDFSSSSSSSIFHDVLKNCITTEFSAESVTEPSNLEGAQKRECCPVLTESGTLSFNLSLLPEKMSEDINTEYLELAMEPVTGANSGGAFHFHGLAAQLIRKRGALSQPEQNPRSCKRVRGSVETDDEKVPPALKIGIYLVCMGAVKEEFLQLIDFVTYPEIQPVGSVSQLSRLIKDKVSRANIRPPFKIVYQRDGLAEYVELPTLISDFISELRRVLLIPYKRAQRFIPILFEDPSREPEYEPRTLDTLTFEQVINAGDFSPLRELVRERVTYLEQGIVWDELKVVYQTRSGPYINRYVYMPFEYREFAISLHAILLTTFSK